MNITIFIIFIGFIAFFAHRRFNSYRSNELLMFAMKQSHLLLYLYNKHKEFTREEIYAHILGLNEESIDEDPKIMGKEILVFIKQNFLAPKQEVTFKDIVKFSIIRKAYKTTSSRKWFGEILMSNQDLLIRSALFTQEMKTNVGAELKNNNFTQEQQLEFVKCLDAIENAVNTAIPEGY